MEYFLPFLWVYYYEDPVDPDASCDSDDIFALDVDICGILRDSCLPVSCVPADTLNMSQIKIINYANNIRTLPAIKPTFSTCFYPCPLFSRCIPKNTSDNKRSF